MSIAPQLSADGKTLRIRVPIEFKKRGGRKLVVTPPNGSWNPPAKHVDNTIVKALARGYRWRRMLETGEYGSIPELAKSEKINQSYLRRLMRLSLLAPDIVEMILDGKQPPALQLRLLQRPLSTVWKEQREYFELEN